MHHVLTLLAGTTFTVAGLYVWIKLDRRGWQSSRRPEIWSHRRRDAEHHAVGAASFLGGHCRD
jgi:predicted metal-binding membrane protein